MVTLFRPDKHGHLPPFHLGRLQDNRVFLQLLDHFVQNLHAESIGINYLTAAKTQGDLNLVLLLQKLLNILDLEFEIMLLGLGPELDFLDLDNCLFLLGFLLFLGLLVAKLAKIHDPANRRNGRSRKFNKIQPCRFGICQRFTDRDDPYLLPFLIDEPDFLAINLMIDSGPHFPLWSVTNFFSFDTHTSVQMILETPHAMLGIGTLKYDIIL